MHIPDRDPSSMSEAAETVRRLADRASTPQPLPASLFKTRFGALPPLLAERCREFSADKG